ncbi:ankyrin repeat domain-containing protein [Psychroserpens sp. MEBiC05023]
MTENELFFDAIKSGKNDVLKTMLNANPKLGNEKDARGFTPLIFATYFDNEQATIILLEHGVDVDARDGTGNSALIGVCFKGNVPFVERLLNYGADINAKNNLGTTALIFATMYNKEGVIKYLIERGADKTITDNEGKTAYQHAEDKGYTNLLKILK